MLAEKHKADLFAVEGNLDNLRKKSGVKLQTHEIRIKPQQKQN